MSPFTRRLLETIIPLLLAGLAVRLQQTISQVTGSSLSTLLLAMVLIAFLIPQLRRYVLTVICFGMCVFAGSRVWSGVTSLDWERASWLAYAVVGMWLGISLLSGLAGIGTVWYNSPIWSQQCYLLAVSLYFLGHSGSAWLQGRIWSSLLLLLTGIAALGGVVWLARPTPVPQTTTGRQRRVRWIGEAGEASATANPVSKRVQE